MFFPSPPPKGSNSQYQSAQRQISQRFSRAATTYDAYADIQCVAARNLAVLTRLHIPPASLLLDAGCGTGMFTSLLHEYSIVQLDRAEGMCAVAAHRSSQPILCGDVVALPLRDGTFDGYISSLCWQWVTPLLFAIREMQRVLKSDGIGVIATLTHGTFTELARSYEVLQLPRRMLVFHESQHITEWMRSCGLIVLHCNTTPHVTHHGDAASFLHGLRRIGATATHSERPLTRTELGALIHYYDASYRDVKGVRATYNITSWVVQKDA